MQKSMQIVFCGLFGISDDFAENYQSLDERFLRNKVSTFFFLAHGDSMEPTIFKGDILLVDRSCSDFHNRVCVLSYEGSLICKRVVKRDSGLCLISDNPRYQKIEVYDESQCELWGVVSSRHGEVM